MIQLEEIDDIEETDVDSENPRNEYREAAERAYDFFRCWAMVVKEFKGQRAFAFDCGLLALGWTEILGCDSQVELAARWKCEREMVRKLVNRIQRMTGAPPLSSQRSESGKNKMWKARRKQLK
jgi:hypothetical protein